MSGQELFEVLVQNTGLPEGYVRERLEKLLAESGTTVESLDLDKVRGLLEDLLLDLINESQEGPAQA